MNRRVLATVILGIGLLGVGAIVARFMWSTGGQSGEKSGNSSDESSFLRGITATSASERHEAWNKLLSSPILPDIPTENPIDRQLDAINSILDSAQDAALLDGSDALRRIGRWGWDYQPDSLVLRETGLRATRPEAGSQFIALEQMEMCPLDAPAKGAMDIYNALLSGDDDRSRGRAFKAACGWIGLDRPALLERLAIHPDDDRLGRFREMAITLAQTVDARPVAEWSVDEPRLASIARDRDVAIDLRREAAWRLLDAELAIGVESTLDVLDADVGTNDGFVSQSVLLTEGSVPRATATQLAAIWLKAFDDDRKRAGAMLSALLDANAELLQSAYEREDTTSVRTAQRLALDAMGLRQGAEDPIEFAHRTLYAPPGDFNIDTAACLLIAGDLRVIDALTQWPREAAERLWLVRRFLPDYWKILKQSSSSPAAMLAAEARGQLRVLHALGHRRLDFDSTRREFTIQRDGG